MGDALDSIPEALGKLMDNVWVAVEERDELGEGLLGLYEGVPLTEREAYGGMVLPDRITIYRRPTCEMCETEDEVVDDGPGHGDPRGGPPLRHRRRPPGRAGVGVSHAGQADVPGARGRGRARGGSRRALHSVRTVLCALARPRCCCVGAVASWRSSGYSPGRRICATGCSSTPSAEALDGLLLVFILLELLAGDRQIMAEHRLVAEPFLIVGIAASIKEVVSWPSSPRTHAGRAGRAGADRGLGRPPRQRHPGHVLRGRSGALPGVHQSPFYPFTGQVEEREPAPASG